MARKSKYQQMVGTITEGVMVVDYERQTKVSKGSCKKYYSYRLWVTADGEHMIEISTQSWNKWSFMKRLEKITTEWIYLGQDTQEERDEHGLTKRERDALIRKYGYAGVVEDGRFWRADEYEEMKKEQQQQKDEWKKEQDEKMKQFEYELMIEYAYKGLAQAHEKFTMDIDEIKTNCLLYGFITNKEVYIEKFFGYVLNEMELKTTFLVAWHDETVYQLKFLDEIWDEVEQYVRAIWSLTDEGKQAERDAEWREYQQFIGANKVEGRNEYDELFDGLDEKQAKRMYRKLSRELHPDMGGTQQEFQAMHEAYERHGVVREVSFDDWWWWKELAQEMDITFEEWMQPTENLRPKYLCA